jgi:hypothetical protein
MYKPNLFLVGVPKSGTTSMHDYLGQHPEIFMVPSKEPFYFASDINLSWRIGEKSQYLSLFRSAENSKYVGESSTGYMYSKVAASNIKKFCPNAKIIVMLRHPVDMIYSWHGHLLLSLEENILDFEEALAAQEDRKQGKRVPEHCEEPKLLLYFDIVKYSEQLKRYLDLFGPDNVHVILFDDFSKKTAITYRQTLDFLEVEPGFEATFEIKNAAKPLPNLALRSFLLKYPALKAPLALFSRKRVEWVRDNVVGKLTQRQRKAIKPLVRSRLTKLFEPEIKELGFLLGRDLNHWLC